MRSDLLRGSQLTSSSVQVGDHKFSAHRIVLAATIPYFHAMFTNDMVECKQDEILMQGMDPRYLRPVHISRLTSLSPV